MITLFGAAQGRRRGNAPHSSAPREHSPECTVVNEIYNYRVLQPRSVRQEGCKRPQIRGTIDSQLHKYS